MQTQFAMSPKGESLNNQRLKAFVSELGVSRDRRRQSYLLYKR